LQRVLEILGRHHGAIRSTVVLLNEMTQDIELEVAAGAIDPGGRTRFRTGEGITGQVLQSGKPVVVPHFAARQEWTTFARDQ
jgi:Nif-specific regulatory protein